MSFIVNIGIIIAISAYAYVHGLSRAVSLRNKQAQSLHSLPHYYGLFPALTAFIPAALCLVAFMIGDEMYIRSHIAGLVPAAVQADPEFSMTIQLAQLRNIADGLVFGEPAPWMMIAGAKWAALSSQIDILASIFAIGLAICGAVFGQTRIQAQFRARNQVERIIIFFLASSSLIAIITTIGIVVSVVFESLRFFQLVPVTEFLFNTTWNPQFEGAERAGSGGANAVYGSVPLFAGTLLISVVALSVAVPVGLFSAIFLSEYATPRQRAVIKPVMELLAGVPTVVYGFFAALTVAPFVRDLGASIGLDVASESALAAGFVMGIMIIPFVSSLSDDVINAVPQSLRDAAYGLGSTKSETVRQVVLPAALSGIAASILLAVSRAVGETMIVVMAAGLAANLSFNPFDAVTTVTSQIVTILVGDQEFESAKTLSAFALALTLIIITLALNMIALAVVKRYKEQYD
ncbi:MAG: phosphate ABC transporter permease subunit PstC [Alphaproteobacteria bacterium]|nr:phosphate ABC transporter permease subunit PstC [Alphaproteobacteria bacterium]